MSYFYLQTPKKEIAGHPIFSSHKFLELIVNVVDDYLNAVTELYRDRMGSEVTSVYRV